MTKAVNCSTCALLQPYDHEHFKFRCSWKMTEAAPTWVMASWRPSDQSAVYPDSNWSDRLRWGDVSRFGVECAAHRPTGEEA